MTVRWQDRLKPSGLYYDGFISGKELDDILEHHRRDTASTFGTRKSSNVSARASTPKSSDHTTKAPNSDENDDPNATRKPSSGLYWRYTAAGTTVDFKGVPFSVGERKILDCQHGVQYYKPKKGLGKRNRLQGTRKIGCKAHIVLREYILYPEYNVAKCYDSKRQERLAKEEQLKKLRADLESGEKVQSESRYYVSLPTEEAHHNTHPTRGAHIMAQRVNPYVAQKISELVAEGMIDPQEIKRALKHYVNTVLCANNRPDPDDRAYYPTPRDLQNHIYKAKRALQLSKLDQHNLRLKIDEWKTDQKSSFYFRPYAVTEGSPKIDTEIPELQQNLLWVHQTQWRKEMLVKYGNTMTLIDATYKTTLYDVPLFFVTVRTNVGYTVAAEFIVQSETSEDIEEALGILKEWNPQWKPSFFMCDYSEAEIGALESAFPTSTVYICDFHREQSWRRWVKDHKHGLTSDEADELLDLLRSCAWAPPCFNSDSEEQTEDHFYLQAVERLKVSQVWLQHETVQTWLNNYWLCIPKRWARAYRDTTFHNCVDTNNGTESLNKALKYTYLPRRKQLNLSGVVTTIVETFLPALRQKYLFANFEQSSSNRAYNNHIPVYLHNRPRKVILHCLDRKASSSKYSTEDIEDIDSNSGVFRIKSGDSSYTVDFQTPSCTCPDWTQMQCPCKHFFAVFRLRYPQWTWNSLPNSYLTSPRLILDQQSIDNYFNTTSDPLLAPEDSLALDQDLHAHNEDEDLYSSTLPKKQNSARELKKAAQNARITLKAIESLTYECSDGVLLKELDTKLKQVMEEFRNQLPVADGLIIRSTIKERVQRAEKNTQKISALPAYKPCGRKKADSAYRNRVGQRADALRKPARTTIKQMAHRRARVIKQQSSHQQPPQNTQQASTKEEGAQTSSQQVITGKKRRRCGTCPGCVAEDCQECPMCLDKPKYGGKGKKKQCCLKRRCLGLCSIATLSSSTTMPITTNSNTARDEMLKEINQPLMKYVKLPGTNFPDELPLNPPSARRIQSFSNANAFLATYDRTIHPIKGDGNCLFRALSYLILGAEDHHQQVRLALTYYTTCNSEIFANFCTPLCTLEEHTARMKYETVWGTDLEIKVAATYFQLSIYVCTQRSGTLTYYWECFQPVLSNNLHALAQPYFETPLINALDHLELCHSDRCHYDTVIMSDGFRPVYPPTLDNSVTHMDLTDS